jgi:arabinofuranan 3-O-arabinosyltransferase
LAKTAERGGLDSVDSRLFFGAGSGADIARELKEGPRWAKGLWVAALLIGILDVIRWHHGDGFSSDSLPVWRSAHAVLHGGASWGGFVYLTGCLLIAFPLALFPFKLTQYLVYAVQILGLFYTFWAMTRVIKIPLGSVRVAWAALLLVLCGQLGIVAHYENFTLLLVPLAAAFFLAIDRERPMSAAVILGISLTLKPLLAPLLLVLLLSRRWRESAIAVLIPLVLSAITMLIVVAVNANPSKFWNEVTSTFSQNTGKPWNMSLSAMAGYLHASDAVGDLARAIVLVACLITCWRLWRHPRHEGATQAVWLTAPLFVVVILCFSFSWGYYCLLLLPLGFVSLQRDHVADWTARLGVFLALAPPILVYSIPGYAGRYYTYTSATVHHIFALGILLNAVCVIGVLIALVACMFEAFADELPATFQSELGSRGSKTTATPDVVA